MLLFQVIVSIISLLFCVILAWITIKRNRMLKLLKNTRINIARDLHDEIGATLSSISFYCEACKINLLHNKTEPTLHLIDKIGTSSRDTIYSMNEIVWMINPKNDHLEKLFDRIEDFGKTLFVSRGITFYFYRDHHLLQMVLPVEWRKNLYLIIKEALNNIAKYASCTQVEVLITRKKSMIEVRIKDNGVGFNPNESKEGNGLLNMRVRAASLGSKLHIDSSLMKGTVVSFSLPYPHKW